MDAYKFEKMAAIFGLFGKEFIKSLNRAEKDYKAGRVKKIKSDRKSTRLNTSHTDIPRMPSSA